MNELQGSSHLLGPRFSACFVLKFAIQRGERASKGREHKFQNKAHRTFDPRNTFSPVREISRKRRHSSHKQKTKDRSLLMLKQVWESRHCYSWIEYGSYVTVSPSTSHFLTVVVVSLWNVTAKCNCTFGYR